MYHTEYEGFEMMDVALQWEATRWTLEDIDFPLADYSLCTVGWLRDATGPIKFWPPPKGAPRRRRRKVGSGAGKKQPIADDGASSESVSSGTEKSDIDGGGGHTACPGGEPWGEEMDRLLLELETERRGSGAEPGCPGAEPHGEGDPGGDPDWHFPWPRPGFGDPDPPQGPAPAEEDAPPPPPPHVGRGAGGGGKQYDKRMVRDAHGATIGYILINEHSKQLDAHCGAHGDTCAMGRTYTPYVGGGKMTPARSSRGRPLGFCVAWLRCGADCPAGVDGRNAHFELSRGRGAQGAVLRD